MRNNALKCYSIKYLLSVLETLASFDFFIFNLIKPKLSIRWSVFAFHWIHLSRTAPDWARAWKSPFSSSFSVCLILRVPKNTLLFWFSRIRQSAVSEQVDTLFILCGRYCLTCENLLTQFYHVEAFILLTYWKLSCVSHFVLSPIFKLIKCHEIVFNFLFYLLQKPTNGSIYFNRSVNEVLTDDIIDTETRIRVWRFYETKTTKHPN